jgi:hypothetical protein
VSDPGLGCMSLLSRTRVLPSIIQVIVLMYLGCLQCVGYVSKVWCHHDINRGWIVVCCGGVMVST